MKERIRVFGTTALLKLISGNRGDADTGLFLHGSMQCFDLAEALLEAGKQIAEAERTAPIPPEPSFYRSRSKKKG